jgi:hypothetical protein
MMTLPDLSRVRTLPDLFRVRTLPSMTVDQRIFPTHHSKEFRHRRPQLEPKSVLGSGTAVLRYESQCLPSPSVIEPKMGTQETRQSKPIPREAVTPGKVVAVAVLKVVGPMPSGQMNPVNSHQEDPARAVRNV